jgi:hypothetical protein
MAARLPTGNGLIMEQILNKEIHITYHPVDGFTLSYIDNKNRYHKQRYIGYTVREAKRRFKLFIQEGVANV